MRKIIYQVWTSLDGYAADADHSTKFFEDPKYGERSDKDLLDEMDHIDTILLGANTYKMFVEFWPNATTDTAIMADKLNSTPKIVFSKTLKDAPWGKWPAAEVIGSDAIQAIKKLKEENKKDLVLWGSLSLATSLLKENLIDEFHIRVVPVVLGKGVALFKSVSQTNLKFVKTTQYPSGVVLLQYARD